MEAKQVQHFTMGLRPPLSLDVEVHNPHLLAAAMSLARKLELQEQCASTNAPAAQHQLTTPGSSARAPAS
jgi:hypothetical protein